MKILTLVRHAKSSWEHNVIDHERPLKKRGIEDAYLVSSYFKSQFSNPDLVISSDAIRAKITANIFIAELKINEKIVHFNHELYDFSGTNLIEIVKECDNSVQNLMLFGHNHAITAFVNTYGNTYIDNVPTCGVVTIEFNIEKWNDLNQGKTIKTIFPKDLKSKL